MRQEEFGYRIRQALEESAARLDYRTTFRLAQARKVALSRLQPSRQTAPELAVAGGPALEDRPHGALWHSAWVAPLLALVVGFVGIYQYQSAKRSRTSRISTSPSCSTPRPSAPTPTMA